MNGMKETRLSIGSEIKPAKTPHYNHKLLLGFFPLSMCYSLCLSALQDYIINEVLWQRYEF